MWRVILICLALLQSIGWAGAQDLPPPVDNPVISGDFGPRKVTNGNFDHRGIDYGVPVGTQVHPVESGTITEINFQPGKAGWYVTIASGSSKRRFQYLHLFEEAWPTCDLTTSKSYCEVFSKSKLPVTLVAPMDFSDPAQPNTPCYAIVFWSDDTRTQASRAYSNCNNFSIGGITASRTVPNIDPSWPGVQGSSLGPNTFTVSGESGAARKGPHLHLAVKDQGRKKNTTRCLSLNTLHLPTN